MMHGGFGIGGFGTLGWIGMILNLVITLGVIIGVVLLVVWLVRRVSTSAGGTTIATSRPGGGPDPREILKVRYARGEITREEFQHMLADIG